jgi:uncharacterized membrane protein YgaE (UPF0421/DUF939 family)
MSSLSPRPDRRPTRRERERNAYRLVVAGGTAGGIAVVGALLALITSFSWTPAVLAALVAVICVLLFRRTISGS